MFSRILPGEDRAIIGQAVALTVGVGGSVVVGAFVLGLAWRALQLGATLGG